MIDGRHGSPPPHEAAGSDAPFGATVSPAAPSAPVRAGAPQTGEWLAAGGAA